MNSRCAIEPDATASPLPKSWHGQPGASRDAKAARVVVISPERDEQPREAAIVAELFAAGLERYHVRKPDWTLAKLEAWLRPLPAGWRGRIVVHQHHELLTTLGLGGVHFRDSGDAGLTSLVGASAPFTSRSCHDLPTLRAALGCCDAVFFSPVFPSISKPGYGPREDVSTEALRALLANRTGAERHTAVLALGGITEETAPRALALGFDGVAVLGAIWGAADPVRAYLNICAAVRGINQTAATASGPMPAQPGRHA